MIQTASSTGFALEQKPFMVTELFLCVSKLRWTVFMRIDLCLKRNKHNVKLYYAKKSPMSTNSPLKRNSTLMSKQYYDTISLICVVKYFPKDEISLADNICGQGNKESWIHGSKKYFGARSYQNIDDLKVQEKNLSP